MTTLPREVERHRANSLHYLENASLFLAKGDAEKASEFLWGSMAQALKAVAALRGIRLRSHNQLKHYGRKLAEELRNPALFDAYVVAESLHSNFYETELSLEDVAARGERIKEGVRALLGLTLQEPAEEATS